MSYSVLHFLTVTSAVPVDDESQEGGVLLSATKLYIVIGCIAALVLIAVIQAGCTIYKTVRNPSSYHKVSSMLIALVFFFLAPFGARVHIRYISCHCVHSHYVRLIISVGTVLYQLHPTLCLTNH